MYCRSAALATSARTMTAPRQVADRRTHSLPPPRRGSVRHCLYGSRTTGLHSKSRSVPTGIKHVSCNERYQLSLWLRRPTTGRGVMLKKGDFFPQALQAVSRFLLPPKELRMLPPGNVPVPKSNTSAQAASAQGMDGVRSVWTARMSVVAASPPKYNPARGQNHGELEPILYTGSLCP